MGYADLHIHSIYSYDGTTTIPAILKHTADHTDLNVIAITDHDTMSGVRQAVDLAPRYGLEVIPGFEVSTSEGHMLALFINQPVPSNRPLAETVLRVGALGGLCIAAHPQARGASSLTFRAIRNALSQPGVAQYLVGVEAFNGGLVYTRRNSAIAIESAALPLAQVGNSDAHILSMIGHGSTEFEGTKAADLRRALLTRQTQFREGKGLTGIRVLTAYVPQYVLRMMGWAAWNAGPQEKVKYMRLSHTSVER
jgi:predicted metal-dependent phosphoesterase TrpH